MVKLVQENVIGKRNDTVEKIYVLETRKVHFILKNNELRKSKAYSKLYTEDFQYNSYISFRLKYGRHK